MKLSAKTRYGIASLIYIATKGNNHTSLTKISKELEISKIYLEQIFSELKEQGIVNAIKGPSGGYSISNTETTVYDAIYALEPQLLEKTEDATNDSHFNEALQKHIYALLDEQIKAKLQSLRLLDISESINREKHDSLMYYI